MRYSFQSLVIIATLTFVAGVFSGLAIDQGNQLLRNPTPVMDLASPDVKEVNSERVLKLGNAELTVRMLDTDEERIQGLSGRKSLPADEGYLFVFDVADEHGIWMKDMRFPIDILWLDSGLKVVHIEHAVDPETYPEVFRPGKPALFVLEANSGFAKDNNIEVGSMATFVD